MDFLKLLGAFGDGPKKHSWIFGGERQKSFKGTSKFLKYMVK